MSEVGVWRSRAGTTFAVCHGHHPGIVIDLDDAQFDRIVVTIDDPGKLVSALLEP